MELRDADHRAMQKDISEVKGDVKVINTKLDALMKDQEDLDNVKEQVIRHGVQIQQLNKFMYSVWGVIGLLVGYVIQQIVRNGL